MSQLDNPAGRLHSLFARFAEYDRPNDSATFLAVAATHFGLDPSVEMAEVVEQMAEVYRLPSEIRRDVRSLPFDGSRLVQRLPDFEQVLLSLNLHSQIHRRMGPVTEASLEGLDMCSEVLHQTIATQQPSAEDMAHLLELVLDLRNSIADSEIDSATAERLIWHLDQIEVGVRSITISGTRRLKSAVHEAIGDFVVSEVAGEPVHMPPPIRSKLWLVVERASHLSAIAATGLVLSAGQPAVPDEPSRVVQIHIQSSVDLEGR